MHRLNLEWDGGEAMLSLGDHVTFGRQSSSRKPDLVITTDQRVHALSGLVEVLVDCWVLTNMGGQRPLQITRDGRAGRETLLPGEVTRFHGGVAEIGIRLSPSSQLTFSVKSSIPSAQAVPNAVGSTVLERVDEGTLTFWTLLALCEPSLRAGVVSEIPTDMEIAQRLLSVGLDPDSAMRAAARRERNVSKRLRDVRDKLGLTEVGEDGQSDGLGRPDAKVRLIDLAIAMNLVSRENLRVFDAADADRGSPP